MRILITGAAGFIGGHLYQKLTTMGHEVIGIDNFFHPSKKDNNEIIKLDIRAHENPLEPSLEDYVKWADIVYHLAAQIHVDYSIQNPVETFDINVSGTIRLLELCRAYGKKLVFASSSEIYGTNYGDIKETSPLNPQSPYAVTKLTADKLCTVYKDIYNMKVDVVRNFNTFGEYQNDTSYGGAIAIFTKNALANEPLKIYGDGNQERDYMYVEDALQGYLTSLTTDLPGPTNFGTGQTITINDLAKLIISLTNSKSEIIHVEPRPGEVRKLCADISLAKSIGFKPTTNLERDLRRYTQWYENFNHR